MLNCVTLMGRLTADPEVRTTTTGKSVCTFSIAVDRSFARAGEQRQTDFINIVAWENTATFISRYFAKGSMIAIQGSIQTRPYEDKNGTLESSAPFGGNDGVRNLAYAIDDETTGAYIIMNYASAPEFPAELERIAKITDGVLRVLTIRK